MATVERFLERCFIDQPAARAVDDADALFALGDIGSGQDIARLIGQRRVQGDEIGLGEQRVEISLFDAHFDRAFSGEERIKGDHFHFEAKSAAGDDGANIARADQTQCLAGDFDAHEPVLFPLAGLSRGVGLWQLAGKREHQRDGMFGGGDRIAKRRVHHHDALHRRGGDIDIVDADPGPANDLQVGCGFDQLLGQLGGRADRKAIILADNRFQFFGRFTGDDVYVTTAFAENLFSLGVHLVGNEYAWFGHDFNSGGAK